jgi:exonuclease VII large subunit
MDASAGSHPYTASPLTPKSISPAAAIPDGLNAAIPNCLNATAKKRRASTTGSRGVANLTPEQLAKKRANDREAQRAIRERTKGQIETLEKRIEELTSQQPYQELQHAIRQKEMVEAENEDIKKKLASALSILQPLLGSYGGASCFYRIPTQAP